MAGTAQDGSGLRRHCEEGNCLEDEDVTACEEQEMVSLFSDCFGDLYCNQIRKCNLVKQTAIDSL